MGKMYWVRVVMMILTLGLVIMAIRNLNRGEHPAAPFVGSSTTANPSDPAGSPETIVLCPTRVTALNADGFRIVQDGLKWIKDSAGKRHEVNGNAVEEWFALFCKSAVEKASGGGSFIPVLGFEYVTGVPGTLERSSTGEFRWQGQVYNSRALDGALRALMVIPSADNKAPGQN